MCLSIVGQIAFGILMFIALCLTLGSLFTPGWNESSDGKHRSGIITGCPYDDESMSTEDRDRACKDWFKNQPGWLKAIIVMMCLAILLEVFAIAWCIASFCACCCRKYFLHVLPVVAFLAFVLLAASMIVFGIKHKNDIDTKQNTNQMNDISYSFYLGIAAAVVALASAVMGSVTSCLADKCC